ncbi:MAG: RDD family protein [Phycisphaerales bacterium]|nr:RDD family protein [Phycisphaerales bacterium]
MSQPAFFIRFLTVAWLAGYFLTPSAYAEPAPPAIHLAGGEEVAWAWRFVATTEGKPQLVFAFADARDDAPHFYRLTMRPTSAEVPIAAERDGDLHIFFKDGTHYRLRVPPDLANAPQMTKNDFPELRLPDGRVPVALCADETQSGLYAIVPQNTAQAIIDAVKKDADADTNGPRPADIDLSSGKFALVRYNESVWSTVAPLPPEFDDHQACWLVCTDKGVQLLFARKPAPSELLHARRASDAWAFVKASAPTDPAAIVAACTFDDTVVLITRSEPDGEKHVTLTPLLFENDAWQTGETLKLGDEQLRIDPAASAAGRLGEYLIVAWAGTGKAAADGANADATANDPNNVYAARWPIGGGAPRAQPVAIIALAGAPEPVVSERSRQLLTLAAMTIMLVVVMLRRRDSFITDLPVPEGYVLARLSRRFLALMIDLIAVGIVVYPALAISWMAQNGIRLDERFQEQFLYAYTQDQEGVFWRWLIAVAVFALYGIVFEATLGATPGKLALRLRVFDDHAKKPSFGAIVLRNLTRFEIYPIGQFSPISILVALTRNRQRIGDLISNTIVAEKS